MKKQSAQTQPILRNQAYQELWEKAHQTEIALANISSRLDYNHPDVKYTYSEYILKLQKSVSDLKQLIYPQTFLSSKPSSLQLNTNPAEYAEILQNIINLSQKTTFSLFKVQDQTIWK